MIPFAKGMKLPHGMSMDDAKRAFAAVGECSKLIDQLLNDPDHSNLIRLYIRDHQDLYPNLFEAISNS